MLYKKRKSDVGCSMMQVLTDQIIYFVGEEMDTPEAAYRKAASLIGFEAGTLPTFKVVLGKLMDRYNLLDREGSTRQLLFNERVEMRQLKIVLQRQLEQLIIQAGDPSEKVREHAFKDLQTQLKEYGVPYRTIDVYMEVGNLKACICAFGCYLQLVEESGEDVMRRVYGISTNKPDFLLPRLPRLKCSS
ncbi:hypothetical protein MHB77_30135 [Paenibacillus sp. FSL K6-3166]|uniref:hypothetical protein n=1 Tax=Paenibacillus sp. FSL K6-3166 TaxID=2921492 RepID=UPI0030FADBA9